MKSVKVFLGLLAGFAAGALIGILFSPEKKSKIKKEKIKSEKSEKSHK